MDYTATLLLPTTYHGIADGNYDGSSSSFSGPRAEASTFYHGLTSGKQTITISASQFFGLIQIQATLVADPQESDWVTVHEYGDYSSEVSDNSAVTILGNYVWLRAVVSFFEQGVINEIRAIY